MKQFSFPKKKKLVKDRQFKAVLSRGLRASNGLLTLYIAENDCGYPRLGVSVSKSYGSAVVRNRLKRLMREAFRQKQDKIPPNFDYLLIISPQLPKKIDDKEQTKKNIKQLTFEQVRSSFSALVSQLRRAKNLKSGI